MLRPLFHLSVVAINSFVFCYDLLYVNLPMPSKAMESLPLRSRSMFLTTWCLILQTIYHSIAFLNDVVGTNAPAPKKPSTIRRIKDTLFPLACSIASYVTLIFWCIYFVDKELIFPEHIAKLYHPSFNHVMHSTVGLFILIELLTSNINFPSRKVSFRIIYTFLSCYFTWLFIIYFKTGAWVYPIYDYLNWPGRILFTAFSLAIVAVFFTLCEKLHSIVNVNQEQSHTNGSNKGKNKQP